MPTFTELFIDHIKKNPSSQDEAQKNKLALSCLLEASKALAANELLASGQIDFETKVTVTIMGKPRKLNLFQFAVYSGNEEIFDLLVGEMGIYANTEEDGVTALLIAVSSDLPWAKVKSKEVLEKRVRIITYLMHHHVDVNYYSADVKNNALTYTIKQGDYALTRFLLLNGANTELPAADNSDISDNDDSDNSESENPLLDMIPFQHVDAEKIEAMLKASMFLRGAILDPKVNSRMISLHLAIDADAGYSLEYCSHLAKLCIPVSAEEINNLPGQNHTRFLKMALPSIALLVDNGFIDDLDSSQIIEFSLLLEALHGIPTLFESEEAKQNFIRKSKEKLLERLRTDFVSLQQKIKAVSSHDPQLSRVNALLQSIQELLNILKSDSSEKISAVLQIKQGQLLAEAIAIYQTLLATDKIKKEAAL